MAFDWDSMGSRFAALGAGLQGQDAMAPRREYQAGIERDERKVNIAALMDNMGIGANRRATLEMLPQQQQLSWLMSAQDQQAAQAAAAAAAGRNAAAEAAEAAAQAEFAAMMPQQGGPQPNVAPQQNAWNAAVSAPLVSTPFTGPQVPTSIPESAPYEVAYDAPTSFDSQAMYRGGTMGGNNLAEIAAAQTTQDAVPQTLADLTAAQGAVDTQPMPVMGGAPAAAPIGAFPSAPEQQATQGDYQRYIELTNMAKDNNLSDGQRAYAALLAQQEEQNLGFGAEEGFRPATPEEAAQYGAAFGQIDLESGRFHASATPTGMNMSMGPDGQFSFTQGPGVTGGAPMDEGATSNMTEVARDFTRTINDDGSVTDTLIKGTPTYIDMRDEAAVARAGLASYDMANKTVVEDTQRAIDLINNADYDITGIGSLANAIPGTKAHELAQLLSTVTSSTALGRLAELKATGATMGALNEREGQWLADSNGSLAQANSEEALLHNLNRLIDIRTNTAERMHEAYDQGYEALGDNKVAYVPSWTYTPPEGELAPTTGDAPVQVQSDADYNALPSGATFIDPDGVTRRKP